MQHNRYKTQRSISSQQFPRGSGTELLLSQATIYNGTILYRVHVSFNRDNIDNTNVAQDILEIDANILTKTETDTSKLVTV